MQLADCVSLTELNTPTYHKREIGMMSAGLQVKNMSLLISTSLLLKRGHKCHYRYFCIAHMKDVFNGMFVFPVWRCTNFAAGTRWSILQTKRVFPVECDVWFETMYGNHSGETYIKVHCRLLHLDTRLEYRIHHTESYKTRVKIATNQHADPTVRTSLVIEPTIVLCLKIHNTSTYSVGKR